VSEFSTLGVLSWLSWRTLRFKICEPRRRGQTLLPQGREERPQRTQAS